MFEHHQQSHAIHFQAHTYGRQKSIVLRFNEPVLTTTANPEYFVPAIKNALENLPDCELTTHGGYLVRYNRKTYAGDKLEELVRCIATITFNTIIDPALYSSKY